MTDSSSLTDASEPSHGAAEASAEIKIKELQAEVHALRTQLRAHQSGERSEDQQNDGQFRRLVEGLQQTYFLYAHTPDGKITYLSPSITRVTGYIPSEAIGKNWREFSPEISQYRSIAEERLAACMRGESPPAYRIEASHVDGSIRIMDVLPRPVIDESGEVVLIEGIGRDVTDIVEAERALVAERDASQERLQLRHKELEYRLQFEALLVSLCTSFLNVPSEQLGARLNDSLRRLGEFTEVDRCFIYEIDEDLGVASLNHEWVQDGATSVKEQMQQVPISAFQWELDYVRNGRVLHVPDAESLAPEAKGLNALYKRLKVRSAINVPLLDGDRIIGVLGFSSVQQKRFWTEDDIAMLQVLGEMLVHTLGRHQNEKKLLASEARFRAVVQNQTELIVRWSPDGRHLFVNEATCRYFGKSEDEIMSSSVYDTILPEDQLAVREKIARLSPSNPTASDTHRVVLPSGDIAWHQWVDRALFNESGELKEIQSAGRDITNLKTTQQQLETRYQFESLIVTLATRFINLPLDEVDECIESAMGSIAEFIAADRCFLFQFSEDISLVSETHEWCAPGIRSEKEGFVDIPTQSFRWSIDQFLKNQPVHTPDIALMPPEARAIQEEFEKRGIRSVIQMPLFSGGKLRAMLGFSSLKEKASWSEDSISLLRVVGTILLNAVERAAADKALRKSEERLAMTITGVGEGLYDWHIPSGEVYFSDYWIEMMGLPHGSNRQKLETWDSQIHPDDKAAVQREVQRHLEGHTDIFECEYRLRRQDGSYRWNLDRGRVIERDESGAPIRMLGVDRDISAEMEQRQKMVDIEAQLAQLARVSTMGETVAAIAHEVNQPLHAAATFCAAARSALAGDKSNAKDKGLELCEKISNQVSRAGDIIRRLRDFTRPRPAEFVGTDVNQVIRESAELMTFLSRRLLIQLELHLDEQTPLVAGDRIQLQQVIVNLLQNAYDVLKEADSASPVVKISTGMKEGRVLIQVSDNGPQLQDGDHQHWFESFYTTKPDGMGIGLSLCRTILANHHGHINVQANPTGGVTFTIDLPPVDSDTIGTPSHPPTPQRSDLDDSHIHRVLGQRLTS